jgi:hypothetical protein
VQSGALSSCVPIVMDTSHRIHLTLLAQPMNRKYRRIVLRVFHIGNIARPEILVFHVGNVVLTEYENGIYHVCGRLHILAIHFPQN